MYYLGQITKVPEYHNSAPLTALYIGNDERDDHYFLHEKDGKIVEFKVFSLRYAQPVRVEDKKSPSGFKIEYGPFCRWTPPMKFKIKPPKEADLLSYLKKIKA